MPASVVAAPRMVVGDVGPVDRAGFADVEIIFLNDGSDGFAPPATLPAALEIGGRRTAVDLARVATSASAIKAGGYGVEHYRAPVPPGGAGQPIVIALGTGTGTFTAVRTAQAPSQDGTAATGPATAGATGTNTNAPGGAVEPTAAVAAKPLGGNAYLGNLSAYAPIYAVYGPGTDSDARLQLSLKYQLFGAPGAVGPGQPWENGIHLGYTQRMFWNLGARSSPFRSVDFMPELFYLVPARATAGRVTIGGQAGFRHESNGRAGVQSRSLNTAYVQPVATFLLGATTLSVGPRAWLYTGSVSDNPDIKRYRGNSGLFVEIGQNDGFRLTANSRINFGSGKGAVDAEASYPLGRLLDRELNLYLFAQGFAGYGENLLDYNRRMTRLRVGFGIVR